MAITIKFGYAGGEKTPLEFAAWHRWRRVHPEVQRRIMALIVWSGYRIGVGGAARTHAEQVAGFTARHRRVDHSTGIWWDGSFWELLPGRAPMAIPGDSYHEPTIDLAGRPDSTDQTGLVYEVEPPKARADVLEYVTRGDVRHSSFAFRVLDETWSLTERLGGERWLAQAGEAAIRQVTAEAGFVLPPPRSYAVGTAFLPGDDEHVVLSRMLEEVAHVLRKPLVRAPAACAAPPFARRLSRRA